jgi:hypothetical protein
VPTLHAILAGISLLSKPDDKGLIGLIKKVAGGMSGLCTPLISVRTNGESSLELEKDPEFYPLACRTKKSILPSSIGLVGILQQGCSGHLCKRVKQAPIKSAIGAIRLIALGIFVSYSYLSYASNPKIQPQS